MVIDYIILGMIVFFIILGWIRGAALQILNFYGWVGAFFLTLVTAPWVQAHILFWISPRVLFHVLGLSLTFLFYLALFLLGARKISLALQDKLGNMNQLLGLVFGAVRGVMWVCVSYFLSFALLPLPLTQDSTLHAKNYLCGQATPWILTVISRSQAYVPQQFLAIPGVQQAFHHIGEQHAQRAQICGVQRWGEKEDISQEHPKRGTFGEGKSSEGLSQDLDREAQRKTDQNTAESNDAPFQDSTTTPPDVSVSKAEPEAEA